MVNSLSKFTKLFKYNFNYLFTMYQSIMFYSTNIKTFPQKKLKKLSVGVSNLFNFNFLLSDNSMFDLANLIGLSLNQMSIPVEHIKIQELTFLSEYFLITALFCLTLFALFSLKMVVDEKHFLIKFQYKNQLIFLLVFVLVCYLILVCQQKSISLLALTSFNDTIYNDQLAIISKLLIGISSILYLIFITQYLEDQKLSNFEYYIILLTSIFGFFLLCGANDLITAYLAIELQGLAFYVLASFKKSSNSSIESGVKYFVLGSLSTAIFLLGVTFIYGLSGSVLLTDFKDFFLWVFSANSFFLSLDSIYKALESFQEKTGLSEDSSATKLQIVLDKLELFKNKFYMLSSDTKFFKLVLTDVTMETDYLNHSQLCQNISEKMSEFYHNQFYLLDKTFIEASIKLVSINDFLIETSFQNASVESLYILENNQLDYANFIDFKTYLLEANFYEDSSFYGFSANEFSLNNESSNFFQISNNLLGEQCLSNIYNLLQCCYFSESVGNILQFVEFLQIYEDSANELGVVGKIVSDFGIETPLFYQSYMFSVMNIVNLNNIFLESSHLDNMEYLFMFDFSFVVAGMLLILLALFFKLALAPFHLWAPDVYEGSPSSSTFFFMIVSKLSLFVFLLRICYSSFYSLISYWQFYSLAVATISIFVGAVAGLKQRRLKSLLAYSSINNMGFVLLAFSTGGFEGVHITFYYLIVYILSGLCIWAIILNLKLRKKKYSEKQNRDLGDLALLQESNNVIAQNLGVTLFTLAGLPPTVGFLAKMGVFKALSGVSMYLFSVINILFSVIATFYYLRVIKIMFFENILVGSLYATMDSKKTFIINFLTFLLLFLFTSPMFFYLYSYKITLFLNKSFY